MSEHFAPEGNKGDGHIGLRVRGTITVEPGAEIWKLEGAEHVVAAACGEARDVPLSPILDSLPVCRIGSWRAPLHPCRAGSRATGGHDDVRHDLRRWRRGRGCLRRPLLG